ncbi:MAG: hypothetical protein CV087_16985 [Candidatus Brocadia sp. WS118]|nr:MAG: hypothetical protein CV087_16985 [Candidatus Brocadia sp. WS118]
MRKVLIDNLKNLFGWRAKQKLVVFAVDDYGNVRLGSKVARQNMDRLGLKVWNRFDAHDTLETREDLEALYETLHSVKDKNGRAAVFTPFALPCNIDFERIAQENYSCYQYELLPTTYKKLSAIDAKAYDGAWQLWKEGIEKGLLRPQFHGREHLNIKVFEEKLAKKNQELMSALENRSYASISDTGYSSIGYTAAFSFWSPDELSRFEEILITGLAAFKKVYGYQAKVFTPPARQFHSSLEGVLWNNGVQAIDKPFTINRHLGYGKYRRELNSTRFQKNTQTATIVRNVVFEPTDARGIDWVNYTLEQIEAAFRWNRPAIISSHRVNYCGHIDPRNREEGLSTLKTLLKKIVRRWPAIEFISAGELAKIIIEEKHV